MKIKLLTLSVMLFSMLKSSGQEVNNVAYNLMLKGLLSHSVSEIDVKTVSQKSNIVFLDSREKAEYEVSHIKGAIWVGYENPSFKKLKDISKQSEIVVYCSVGYRSEKIAEQLRKQGYENVNNLYGGIFEWKNQGMPIIDTEEQITDSVHAYNKVWGIWLTKGIKVYK